MRFLVQDDWPALHPPPEDKAGDVDASESGDSSCSEAPSFGDALDALFLL
eukprot:CAMPEP_0174301396 /NCGR_PEP_ID=MMETSP0809-20121228/59024_1 /TAXON_ID=73025 ORGANISM="Eutreptiella gymnastica-like, Strain CCMP1594" /NCGR_SAMPLE_ID=MMETSP0809 /ASSEMBLY_ACC=CAM_ASM_000658 /LENGTH=49 /DNA_ID=CAMNT_0015407139 /DNA_START=1441 /DNA_END=1591 /DNA_ORIENTATION=-